MTNIKLLNSKMVIGMIHVGALPGTPRNSMNINQIVDAALAEAELYHSAGLNGIMIENMHDVPYMNNSAGPEIVAAMTLIASEIKKKFNPYLGIQILAAANKEALAVAYAAGADFIRAEGFVFAHVADEGIIESNAGELLRYRKQIGAEQVSVFTDVKKKHSSHSITDDVSIVETAKAAEFFLSDGIVVTGNSTGVEANIDEIKIVKENVSLPVIIGSGVNSENIKTYYNLADAFIIGSDFKVSGDWKEGVDISRVNRFMDNYGKCK